MARSWIGIGAVGRNGEGRERIERERAGSRERKKRGEHTHSTINRVNQGRDLGLGSRRGVCGPPGGERAKSEGGKVFQDGSVAQQQTLLLNLSSTPTRFSPVGDGAAVCRQHRVPYSPARAPPPPKLTRAGHGLLKIDYFQPRPLKIGPRHASGRKSSSTLGFSFSQRRARRGYRP